ncbi:MAG: MFS transporter [Nitrososphaerota archaeon]
MSNHLFLTIVPILLPAIVKDLSLNYSAVGLILGLSTLVFGLFQLLSGFLAMAYRRKVILGLGNLLISFGTFASGLASGFYDFLAYRFMVSVGQSPQHPAGTSLILDKVSSRSRGSAIGLHFSMEHIGSILGPVVSFILLAFTDWRGVFIFISLIPLLLASSILLIIKEERLKEHSSAVGFRDLISVLRMLRFKPFLLLLSTQLVVSVGTTHSVLVNLIPLYLNRDLGISPGSISFFLLALFLGGASGSMMSGRLSDIAGRYKTASAFILISSFILYILHLSASFGLFGSLTALFLLGFTSFSISPILQAYLVDIVKPELRDVALTFYYTITMASTSIWLIVVGFILDATNSFPSVFAFMATIALSGVAAITFLAASYKIYVRSW